jgi:hypothetical protein
LAKGLLRTSSPFKFAKPHPNTYLKNRRMASKIGLVQILPTSRDVNSHTAAILREKSVTLAYFVGYRTRNKKQSPGIAIQTRPPAFPGSRFRKACLTREK